jgi:hypothetical protein
MEKNSPEYISYLLSINDRVVERAMIVLYARQTTDEKSSKETRHKNGRGFNSGDAKKGTCMAEYVLNGNHLTGQWLMDARAMCFKYLKQLVEEAAMKIEREQNREMRAV